MATFLQPIPFPLPSQTLLSRLGMLEEHSLSSPFPSQMHQDGLPTPSPTPTNTRISLFITLKLKIAFYLF